MNLLSCVAGVELVIIIALITINWVVSVAAALYKKEFRIRRLADFTISRIIPYVLTWAIISMASCIIPEWSSYKIYVWGIMVLALLGHIGAGLKAMGLKKLPEFITEK